jgi:arylsulfatase A-like enzyme
MQKEFPAAYPTIQWPPERWRQYRWAYYRLVEKVDARIGLILDALRESGQEENTLIIFSSDHGDGLGAHRWNQKQVLYEESVRVPFIVSLKGVTRAGHVDREHLISSGLDLIPTMCDYAGIAPPPGLRGRSVRALAEGRQPETWRNLLVSETVLYTPGKSRRVTGRMLRTDRYKYIVYSQGSLREQLFDITRDPGERVNLVQSPQHQTTLQGHLKRLAAWCNQTDDPFVVPASFSRSPPRDHAEDIACSDKRPPGP